VRCYEGHVDSALVADLGHVDEQGPLMLIHEPSSNLRTGSDFFVCERELLCRLQDCFEYIDLLKCERACNCITAIPE